MTKDHVKVSSFGLVRIHSIPVTGIAPKLLSMLGSMPLGIKKLIHMLPFQSDTGNT